MKKFIRAALLVGSALSPTVQASDVRLQCVGGIPRRNSFLAELLVQGNRVHVKFFNGEGKWKSPSNPSGEQLTLKPSRRGAGDWLVFSGNGARYFELGLRAADLASQTTFSTSVQISMPLRYAGVPMGDHTLYAYQLLCGPR